MTVNNVVDGSCNDNVCYVFFVFFFFTQSLYVQHKEYLVIMAVFKKRTQSESF